MSGQINISNIIDEIKTNRLSEQTRMLLVYSITGLFILFNSYLIYKEFYWGVFIPLAIVVALFYLFAYDKVVWLIILLTPFSVYFLNPDINVGISLPVDPLMFGVMVLFFLKVMFDSPYEKKILKHPVTIFIILNLLWMMVTAFTSQIHVVSFKYFISRLWFVIPMYFVGMMLYKEHRNIRKFFWFYAASLAIIVLFTTYKHYTYGFAEKTSTWVMRPFYNDHTAYGGVMAMFIPVFIGFTITKSYKTWIRFSAAGITFIMFMALFLSFSRAAWLSVAVASGVFAIMILRIKFRWLMLAVLVLVATFYTFRFEILDYLSKNKQDSSTNFVEHVQSIANISSDASNLERINRWQSAIRMFNDRPLFGFGPGTYQFEYAPYQRSKEKTIISTNFGDVGNAHSEYIGPLAESGFLGMLTFLAIAISVIVTGLNVYKQSKIPEIRILSLSVTIGLITYFAHGVLNNFLDTEKLSVPFWGFVAVLVALDLYHKKKEEAPV